MIEYSSEDDPNKNNSFILKLQTNLFELFDKKLKIENSCLDNVKVIISTFYSLFIVCSLFYQLNNEIKQ